MLCYPELSLYHQRLHTASTLASVKFPNNFFNLTKRFTNRRRSSATRGAHPRAILEQVRWGRRERSQLPGLEGPDGQLLYQLTGEPDGIRRDSPISRISRCFRYTFPPLIPSFSFSFDKSLRASVRTWMSKGKTRTDYCT